jgi:hypothetical protein
MADTNSDPRTDTCNCPACRLEGQFKEEDPKYEYAPWRCGGCSRCEQVRKLHDECDAIKFDPIWALANDSAALRMAEYIVATGDLSVLPILADAYEEGGCADRRILGHLRAQREPKSRRDWVVRRVLRSVEQEREQARVRADRERAEGLRRVRDQREKERRERRDTLRRLLWDLAPIVTALVVFALIAVCQVVVATDAALFASNPSYREWERAQNAARQAHAARPLLFHKPVAPPADPKLLRLASGIVLALRLLPVALAGVGFLAGLVALTVSAVAAESPAERAKVLRWFADVGRLAGQAALDHLSHAGIYAGGLAGLAFVILIVDVIVFIVVWLVVNVLALLAMVAVAVLIFLVIAACSGRE